MFFKLYRAARLCEDGLRSDVGTFGSERQRDQSKRHVWAMVGATIYHWGHAFLERSMPSWGLALALFSYNESLSP